MRPRAALLACLLLLPGCGLVAVPPGTTTAPPGTVSASPAAPTAASPAPGPSLPGPSVPEPSGPGLPATGLPATESPTAVPLVTATPVPPAGTHSDPNAIDVVVNKQRPLQPADFAPGDLSALSVAPSFVLRAEAARAVERMVAAASADGVALTVLSAYRSYAQQVSTYKGWVAQYGSTAGADNVSARPGYSEHQTGLALDLGQAGGRCSLRSCFADTAAGIWLAGHGHEFGFVVRYPAGKTAVTGYSPEPWHLRYVGPATATAVVHGGVTGTMTTLEEFWGLPAAPRYP